MHNAKPISVFCVDDNPMIGEAVALKLRLAGGFEVIGQLHSADELVAEAQRRKPQIILLDIDMPGRDPFEAMEELATVQPDTRVIMMSAHVRRDLVDRAFDAGAWGYVSKDNDVQQLPDTIRQVAEGSVVLGADVEAVM